MLISSLVTLRITKSFKLSRHYNIFYILTLWHQCLLGFPLHLVLQYLFAYLSYNFMYAAIFTGILFAHW